MGSVGLRSSPRPGSPGPKHLPPPTLEEEVTRNGIGPAFLHLPSRAGGKQNNTANFTDSPLILGPFSVHPIGPSGAHDSTFDQPSWAPTSKVSKHDLTRIDLTHQNMP